LCTPAPRNPVGQHGASVAEVDESALANKVTSCPWRTSSSVSQEHTRSVPPLGAGGNRFRERRNLRNSQCHKQTRSIIRSASFTMSRTTSTHAPFCVRAAPTDAGDAIWHDSARYVRSVSLGNYAGHGPSGTFFDSVKLRRERGRGRAP